MSRDLGGGERHRGARVCGGYVGGASRPQFGRSFNARSKYAINCGDFVGGGETIAVDIEGVDGAFAIEIIDFEVELASRAVQ